ncbi:MAG: DUF58 domain-containing protein [Acidimicrobiales bacterium]
MITRAGWIALAGALVMVVAGRVFGVLELYLIAAVLVVLVGALLVWSRARRLQLAVDRRVHPPRAHAGAPCTVELTIRNDGPRRSPVLEVRDEVSGTHGARLLVGPLDPGTSAAASYRLPTARRGILRIGPLEVDIDDPFGITETRLRAAGITELTVYPRIDDVAPLPPSSGNDPMAGADHPNALGRSGEDFYALRQYTVGDDLRRVHWPSTARRDELMVRQDELPWQARATVLLDTRAAANSPDSLELVVSAAASLTEATGQRDDLMRVATTDGYDSGFAAGHAHIGAVMEHLACLQAGPGVGFERRRSPGPLVDRRRARRHHRRHAGVGARTHRPTPRPVRHVVGRVVRTGQPPRPQPRRRARPRRQLAGRRHVDLRAGVEQPDATRALVAGWQRTGDTRGRWEPEVRDRHEFDPFARNRSGGGR